MRKHQCCFVALALLLIAALPMGAAGSGSYAAPTLPDSIPATAMPTQSGATVTVAGDCSDLQSRIDAAHFGDTILIPPQATCTGHYILRYKSGGSGWIVIRTAAADAELPPAGTRISPSYSNVLPKLLTPDSMPAISTEANAHDYCLMGLDVAAGPTSGRTPNTENYGLVVVGNPSATSASTLPYNIVLDRDYIHCTPSQFCKRGVEMESASTAVVNSYISEIHNPGQDTQAIGSFNGPGPFAIINNFLEAAGENVIFGGSDPSIAGVTAQISSCSRSRGQVTCAVASTSGLQNGASVVSALAPTDLNGSETITVTDGSHFTYASAGPDESTSKPGYVNQGGLVPSDITVEHNYFFVPENWNIHAPDYEGIQYVVKNLFELKNAQRVLVEGNVFDHVWAGQGQSGYALELTPRNQSGNCPWCVVQDATFEDNIFENVEAGANLLSQDDPNSGSGWSDFLKRVLFFNNVWEGGPLQVMDGPLFQFLSGGDTTIITPMTDVTVDHNTAFQGGAIFNAGDATTRPMAKFTITNNIFPHNAYGMKADDGSAGTAAFNMYFGTSWTCAGNVIEGIQSSAYSPGGYPGGNFFPANWTAVGFLDYAGGDFHLAASSPYASAATDGTAAGADINAVDAATAGVIAGTPSDSLSPSTTLSPPRLNVPLVSWLSLGKQAPRF
ncbi:MAG: hypothetical protein ACRD3D_10380 [Terriglobia bacterium]